MSDPKFNFISSISNVQEDIDLQKIQSASIRTFLKKASDQNRNENVDTQVSLDNLPNTSKIISTQENVPATSEIVQKLPRKEFLKPICKTLGIFLLADYIFNEQEKAQLLFQLHSGEQVDIDTNPLYKRLISTNENTIQKAKEQYFKIFADRASIILTAITECAPLVIAAHRRQIENVGYALYQNGTHQAPDIDGLLRIPYTDVRRLLQNPSFGEPNSTISKENSSDMRIALLHEIDLFRSPNYSLAPYFDAELTLLERTNKKYHQKALEILDRIVQERNYIEPIGSKGIQTKKPISYIKQMSFLTRQVFDKMNPCEHKHIYSKQNIYSKGSRTNLSPVLTLQTWNGEPLTRAHGEVYDAVCTLWAAGNRAVTDLMIARTIWPRASRKGGETFSEKELEKIRQLMDDLRQAYVTIDATAELRQYRKIGKDDRWIISNFAIPCTVIYRTINGGQYLHRAYLLLDTPVFFAYSAALTQILAIPISMLTNLGHDRSPRTLRAAQVRTLLLERLHHFCSPSYRKKEYTVLFERIYEAYGVGEESSDNNELKKERMAARKATINALQIFEQVGLISHYEFRKHSGAYHSIKIDL